eukprot:4357279-Pleurochrysis_carterae.AAC.2
MSETSIADSEGTSLCAPLCEPATAHTRGGRGESHQAQSFFSRRLEAQSVAHLPREKAVAPITHRRRAAHAMTPPRAHAGTAVNRMRPACRARVTHTKFSKEVLAANCALSNNAVMRAP